jgi:hypothetical protein
MFERFKRAGDEDAAGGDRDAVATAERPDGPIADGSDVTVADRLERREETMVANGAATAAALETARARQRDEFGGVNWGASFFGWLVAVGIAALLTSILVAAGAAIGLTESDVTNSADEITLGGGIALFVVLMLAYYTGGYVAGRMSRFDGGRQGVAMWFVGLLITIVAAVLGWVAGDQYNLLDRVDVPRIPIPTDDVTLGGIVTGVIVLLGTLLAAILGGAVGRRYHSRVDRAAL